MRVAIVGPGNMGRGIATRLLVGGHTIVLAGRDRERARILAAELDALASGKASASAASGPEEAIPDSDVVILAMPYAANLEFARRAGPLLGGGIVVDISNPVNESYDGLVTEGGPSAAETIGAVLPTDARMIKAFNTTFAGTLLEGKVAGQMLDIFIAGDDEEANEAVVTLVRTSEMRPIVVGKLERARQLEALGFLGITLQGRLGTAFTTAWKLIVPSSEPREGAKGFPRHAVVGVLDEPGEVAQVVRALTERGLAETSIHVLYGAEGREQIESSLGQGGFLSELLALGYEQEHTQRHLRELDAGHAVVLVEAEDDSTARRVGETLASHRGHFIHHYTRWTAKSITP